MNQRVKELRKALGLSSEKFGEPLGVKRNTISQIETGKNNVSEQMIKAICREYHVNEEWLRTGEGSMFEESGEIPLETLIAQEHLSPLEADLLRAYLTLPRDLRQQALDHFEKTLHPSSTSATQEDHPEPPQGS